MAKTMTVEELMSVLSTYPGHVPVFFYNPDKERDSMIELVELAGPIIDPDDAGRLNWSTPYYCKGISNIEDHWHKYGTCPILCMREKTVWEREENDC